MTQSVHQFTCRGSFHLKDRSQTDIGGENDGGNVGHGDDDGVVRIRDQDDLEKLLDDTFLCNGIATRLRHVADYPLARDREEAVAWFEGSSSPASTSMAPSAGAVGGDSQLRPQQSMPKEDGERNSFGRRRNTQRLGGRRDEGNPNDRSNYTERDDEVVDIEDGGTYSSYGTTQVNVLTLKEVRPPPSAMADAMEENDPFGQFGPLLGAAGMMNPFGSLFGGFFGHGVDPWSGLEDGEESDGRNGRRSPPANPWAAMGGGSRSVSSSTRTAMDRNGKRISTTVTKTTTVDSEGNRRVETETTVRHLDDGGRVERSRVVEEDGNAAKTRRTEEPKTSARSSGLTAAKRLAAQPVEGEGEARRGDETAAADEGPAEVTMIATDCIFGLSISDVPSSDPDMPQNTTSRQQGSKQKSSGSEAGWRQTEYTFRLGRFFPPFMVVGKYYDDPVEDERRRREGKREYDEMREGKRKSRWGKSAERLDDGPRRDDERSVGKISDERLTAAASGTEYYLQRLYVQMNKNLDAMVNIGGAMMTPEFAGKVSTAGGKIAQGMVPAAERAVRLVGDVVKMWVDWDGWGGGDDDAGR